MVKEKVHMDLYGNINKFGSLVNFLYLYNVFIVYIKWGASY
jgi:hypothetical protein